MDHSQTSPGISATSDTGVFEIDYVKILAALGRNILVIILVSLICGGLMLAYTWFLVKPSYTATVLVYVNKGTVSLSGADLILGNGEDVLSTYSTILYSRTTLEEIAETAGVVYSPDELTKMIQSKTSAEKASFLSIDVSTSSPVEAESIANTIASVLPTRVSDIVDGSSLRVVDYAIVPSSRSTTSLIKNFGIGLVAGAFIVCAIIAVSVFIRTNHAPIISSSTDLSQFYPEYPVLGIIRDLTYSDSKYEHGDYGYGKYSRYYSRTNEKAGKKSKSEPVASDKKDNGKEGGK